MEKWLDGQVKTTWLCKVGLAGIEPVTKFIISSFLLDYKITIFLADQILQKWDFSYSPFFCK
jgi:hypothetical protein